MIGAKHLPRVYIAASEKTDTSVDGWLHGELIDFAGTVSRRMERVIPGFRRAYRFPGQ